jgi:hypothetical protein
MNKVAKYAVAGAVALVLGGAVALADDAKPDAKPAVSAAAGKDLIAAQKALQAKNYDEALADLDKVKAIPKKNDYDEFLIDEFTFSAYAGQKKLKEAFPPLEAAMASKYMPPDELKQRLGQAAILAYQMQDYDKAVQYGNRALKEGSPAPELLTQLQTVVSQAYYLKNDYPDTESFVRSVVDEQIKAGQPPGDELLQLGLSSTLKQKDEAGEDRWLALLAEYHPKPEYWENLIQGLYKNKPTDKQQLEIYRLSAEVGILKRGAEYAEMAQLALDQGSPGEAVSTLTNGFTANAFTDAAEKNRNQHLLETAKKSAASDQPGLPKLEADGTTAATGDKLVGVGIGYFSYGDYAKASKDIAAGLEKGMSKDSVDARLILGIAQFKSGDKDSAIKTFQSVKGDPVDQRLAQLWIIHTKAPKAS